MARKEKNKPTLVKPDKLPAGATARSEQKPPAGKKPSRKKAARARKSAKLKEKKETKQRKQGGKGRPFRAKPWEDYAGGSKPTKAYTTEELRDITRRAAKAANSRLRALEKAGLTKWSYNMAARLTGKEKPRFAESKAAIGKLNRQQLESLFYNLREYMTAQTSTVQGMRAQEAKYLRAAQDMGFEGTSDDLSALFEKYMTKELEALLGSDVIRGEIMSGRAAKGSLDYLREQTDKRAELGRMVEEDKRQGALLLESLRKYGV